MVGHGHTRRWATHRVGEVSLLEDMLGSDLVGAQPSLADPASDGLRVLPSAARGFRNSQHDCCILQHAPSVSSGQCDWNSKDRQADDQPDPGEMTRRPAVRAANDWRVS